MARLTMTHTRRWQEHYQEVGYGHLYQGRFKSFPVQEDLHFLAVARYIKHNPLRAGLVEKAGDWQWSSLWRRQHLQAGERGEIALAAWPVVRPGDWLRRIQRRRMRRRWRGCVFAWKRAGRMVMFRGRGRPQGGWVCSRVIARRGGRKGAKMM